jgi:ubiquinone/menaquinone biosynthesis C-methylase UbiE
MRSCIPLYNSLASDFDAFFAVPHRRAYDDLAWEKILPLLPAESGIVVDVGCGVGRWAERFLALGHFFIGIEQAPAMMAVARQRLQTSLPDGMVEWIEGPMEEINLPDSKAHLVVAMGSVQYSSEPEQMIKRFAKWTQPGGWVAILVDSLVALVLELIASGKEAEALKRLETGIAVWRQEDQQAEYHLFDRLRLEEAFDDAGLTAITSCGLLVGASALGRDRLTSRLLEETERQIALERKLASHELLADVGKQILVYGQRPVE